MEKIEFVRNGFVLYYANQTIKGFRRPAPLSSFSIQNVGSLHNTNSKSAERPRTIQRIIKINAKNSGI